MLCIPVIARHTEGAIKKISEAEKQADVCELRLDLMESFDLNKIIGAANKPVLVTYRSRKEGGEGTLDPTLVADYLVDAAYASADYIDVELSMPVECRERVLQEKRESRVIISSHIWDHTPSIGDLSNLLNESLKAQGDIVKIVTMANSMDDNIRVLQLVSEAHEKGIKIIAFCMGPWGRMSRIFSLLMGGFLSFTSMEATEESAPGQIPVNEMRNLLKYFSV